MRRYLDGEVDKAYPQQQNLTEIADADRSGDAERPVDDSSVTPPETDGGAVTDPGPTGKTGSPASPNDDTDAAQSLIDAGESPECPECGSMTLYYSEGCKTCESCGWSEC
jgi:ribonucleoside-diphosphate reductase alpha chain